MQDNQQRIRQLVAERGWPDSVADQLIDAGVPHSAVNHWSWLSLTPDRIERQIQWFRRFTSGDLRGRSATLADNDALAELFDRSPEQVGDWLVFTERSPNAFAQFGLQRNVQLSVIADGSRLIASVGWAQRNVLVAGKPTSVSYGQALRVDPDYQRQGLGDQVRRLPWVIDGSVPTQFQYDFMRTENAAVANWWKHFEPDPELYPPSESPTRQDDPATVTVTEIPAAVHPRPEHIRNTRPADVDRCAELINATHAGQDLFRPYSREFLEDILNEGFWGELPSWAIQQSVYGWPDHYVCESGGRIVACAGLWDRGANLRSRWQKQGESQSRTVSETSVLDFGYSPGEEGAMAALLTFLLDRTATLGRDHLAIALDQLPALAEVLADHEGTADRRTLRCEAPGVTLQRVFTDLRYW